MSLVYRAVWSEPQPGVYERLDDHFRNWCITKGIDPIRIPARGISDADGLQIEVRRADAEVGRALRWTLTHGDRIGRTWTTTATALEGNANHIWVDVDCHDPEGRPPEIAAPRLVKELLNDKAKPREFLDFNTTPTVVSAGQVEPLVQHLSDPLRSNPVLVFSADSRLEPSYQVDRARLAAETLAGCAVVVQLSDGAQDRFMASVPESHSIWRGAMRLYVAPLDFEDPDDGVNHRWWAPTLYARVPRFAGLIVARRIATRGRWADPPSAWDDLRWLLFRPDAQDVGRRVEELRSERRQSDAGPTGVEGEVEALRTQLDELLQLLAFAELDRDQRVSSLQVDLQIVREANARMIDEAIGDAAEREILALFNAELARSLRWKGRTSGEAAIDDDIETPLTSSGAFETARLHLSGLSIPERAGRDLHVLDGDLNSVSWAAEAWRAFVALDDYVAAKRSGFEGDFLAFVREGRGWSVKKTALRESETVEDHARKNRSRTFPIDRGTPGDTEMMFAHLKVALGGNSNIPRLYFHDDTRGSTGKVHVGFFGPHGLVPNSRTN